MTLFIEAIILCILFTLMVKISTHIKHEAFVNDYPPVVIDKLREQGLVAQKPPTKKSDIARKLFAMAAFVALFALMLKLVNGIDRFAAGAAASWLLWLIVDWYDFAVIDILLAPFDKFYRLAQVSAFDRSAVHFHFIGSLKGMLIGVPFALLTGLAVMFLGRL